MEITFILGAEDYLNHQLYLASKSERIINNRRRSWLITTLALISLASLFYQQNNDWLTYYFLLMAVLCAGFFPLYTRWRYKKHYEKAVADAYKELFNKPAVVVIEEDRLLSKDRASEGTINISELREIVEVPTAFYLRISSGQSLLLPKQQIANNQELKAKLIRVADRLQIPYSDELKWQWK